MTNPQTLPYILLATLVLTACPSPSWAEDWPMWRHDAQRTAASTQQLAPQLHLHWSRELPKLTTAWPDQPQMAFDRNYEPIIVGTTMYVGSSLTDTLTALDTRTGAVKWIFHTDGPIRFAPVGWDGKVYFVSDDGYLYCVDGASGRLVWKFRGGPSDRKVLGNRRLISTWPARGAPVIADGIVYFAASIWPFMGIFIHALDARTGAVVWTNDGDGSMYIKQPHNADSFAGIAPQGCLVVVGDRLLIPGGRSVPACYDRRTGKLLYYHLAENSKRGGGSDVAAIGKLVFNGGALFELETGTYLGLFSKLPVLTDDVVHGWSNGKYRSFDLKKSTIEYTETKDRKGQTVQRVKWTMADLGAVDAPKVETMIRAGSRLYIGSPGEVAAVELPLPRPSLPGEEKAKGEGQAPTVSWRARIDGIPASIQAADDRLFVVTLDGRIHCFGAEERQPLLHKLEAPPTPPSDDRSILQARAVLDLTGVREGYCVAWGVGNGRLISELARQSHLHVIAIDPDEKKVQAVRRNLIAAGLYGERVAVHAGDPLTFPLPPYLANLMVAEDLSAAGIVPNEAFARKAFQSLRPYGGIACLELPAASRREFVQRVGAAGLAQARVRETGTMVLLSREGALPGAGSWTHEHGDAANTRVSTDQLVKLPLGLLWFGGSSNQGILPQHGHGPQPQVLDGRLFIEGVDMLRAVDIYTGRVLWEADLPGVGKVYNNLAHQPGANGTGTNYITTSDGIYIVLGKSCWKLDPETGRKLAEFRLPAVAGSRTSPTWGYLNVAGDYLVGGADPLMLDPKAPDAQLRQLVLWDIETQKEPVSLLGHPETVNGVAFSPDGKLLATASTDRTLKLWDTATGKAVGTLKGHSKRVSCLAFAPDGKSLASGSDDATIILWDLGTHQARSTLKGHKDAVICVAFAPDGKMLVSGSADATVKLWEAASGKLVTSLEGLTDDVTCVAFAPDGKTLATGSADASVKLWDLGTREVRVSLNRHTEDVTGVAFSADGKLLATASKDKTVHLWEATGQHLAALEEQLSPVTCLAFAPDGKTLAAGTRNATVYLYDVQTRKVKTSLLGRPGSASSVAFSPDGKQLAMGGTETLFKTPNENLSSSKHLVIMDRHSGKVLWTVQARHGFRHNAICIGGGRLYCIDRLSGGELARLKRRGLEPQYPSRLLALDLPTGKELWSTEVDVFGTWLSYSAKHDVLVEAGRVARDSLFDEPKGMRAYHAASGKMLWQNKTYAGPAMIHGDTILKDQSACDLLTGKPKMRTDPITGQPVEWCWMRNYGCNTPSAAQHLLTFRSGAAGYYDLANDGGTGNFGGFRSGCTNNLIVAGGVLTAPDYTRTCTCSYQNQTSLALVHMPEVEIWTRFPVGGVKTNPVKDLLKLPATIEKVDKTPKPVKHIALNLGAPGHRRAEDGRLWLNEYEHLQIKFEQFGCYNNHSSKIVAEGKAIPWVASSGCRGISELQLAIQPDRPEGASYTLRLHFADPDNDKAGQRAFDVRLQGQPAIAAFDIVKESGGRNRAIVKEFKGVKVVDKLVLQFTPTGQGQLTPATAPLLCGLELVREED